MFSSQGIDLEAGGRNKKTWRTAPKSENVYLKLLVKVGAKLAHLQSACSAMMAIGGLTSLHRSSWCWQPAVSQGEQEG